MGSLVCPGTQWQSWVLHAQLLSLTLYRLPAYCSGPLLPLHLDFPSQTPCTGQKHRPCLREPVPSWCLLSGTHGLGRYLLPPALPANTLSLPWLDLASSLKIPLTQLELVVSSRGFTAPALTSVRDYPLPHLGPPGQG